MHHTDGSFTGTDNHALYRQSWLPEGETRACLALVHGIGEHSSRYPALVEHLTGRGIAVHSFDLRGHGRSRGKRGHIRSWDEYREDIRIFLDLVRQEGKPVFLMGHSLGGLMVLNFAIGYPGDLVGVIASSPALAQNGASPVVLTVARILSAIFPEFTLPTGLDTTAISRNADVVAAYRADPLVHGMASARFAAEMVRVMAWTNAHTRPILPCRCSLSMARTTALCRRKPAASSSIMCPLKRKKRLEYPGGYHESHNDLHAAQAVQDVGDWIDQALSSAG